MKRSCLLSLIGILGFLSSLSAQVRTEMWLEKGWKFTREDHPEAVQAAFDDSKWQSVTVPHDWAIYGPFSIQNDKQNVAISQDGQKEAMEHAGRTGGLPFVGVGWYRNTLEVPSFQAGKKAFILFDGAMSHAKVYINGKKVGFWPYGYNSFWFDITSYLQAGGKNTIAVRLENLPESSRWYPGAGLYRNVRIIVTDKAHIPVWGTYITTPQVNEQFARVRVETKVDVPNAGSDYELRTTLLRPDGTELVKESALSLQEAISYHDSVVVQEFIVKNPQLWSVETPTLYTAVSQLYGKNGELKDEYTTKFGIRSIEIIPDKGFFLNGKKTVFKGVCNHHDLGQ